MDRAAVLPDRARPTHPARVVRRRMLRAPLAIAVACATLLGGCSPDAPRPTPTATADAPTAPQPRVAATPREQPAADWARAELATWPLRDRVASLFLLHRPGTRASELATFARDTGAAGLILMGDNVPGSAADLRKVTAAVRGDVRMPRLVAIDQEGGTVRRLGADRAAAGIALASQPASATRTAFRSRADLLERVGVTLNFGVVADETGDRSSFIYPRVLGTTPGSSATRVAAAVAGERGRVLTTLKHFPGHGVAAGDSHSGIPSSSISAGEWRRTSARPFVAGIDAGAEMVMMGHLRLSAVDGSPASLSAEWHRVLRQELGFDGIIVTDDMLMLQRSGDARYRDAAKNAVRALSAGSTLLLYVLPANPKALGASPTHLVDSVVAAVESGQLDRSRIDDAALRLLTLRRELSGFTSPWVRCGAECERAAR